MMIKKLEVRRRLALLEKKIKEEKQGIIKKMREMRDGCTSMEIEKIVIESTEYVRLQARLDALQSVLNDVVDMRCEEMFEETT